MQHPGHIPDCPSEIGPVDLLVINYKYIMVQQFHKGIFTQRALGYFVPPFYVSETDNLTGWANGRFNKNAPSRSEEVPGLNTLERAMRSAGVCEGHRNNRHPQSQPPFRHERAGDANRSAPWRVAA